MGEVWQAYDVELGRAVALKMLREFGAADEALRRFRREAAIGARLQHPGITVVHDVGHHDGRMFLVMELLEGQDLAELLVRSPDGLPVAEALDLGRQAAEALAAAHAGKVVHRDLKPANLILTDDGRLKICDFGIARTAESTEGLTVTGHPFGSPPYMAPEQWRGEHVNAGCDVYALGCVLFALLTGAPPFSAHGNPFALMLRHLEEPAPDLRSIRSDVPAGVAELAAELLTKDPAARPGAGTVAQRLRELHDTARETARPSVETPLTDTPPQDTPSRNTPPGDTPSVIAAPEDTPPVIAAPVIASPRGLSRRAVVLGGAFAVLAIGAVVAIALVSANGGGEASDNPSGQLPATVDVSSSRTEPEPSFPATTPPPPPDPKEYISSADKDKAPLNAGTLFPGDTFTTGEHTYHKGATGDTRNCSSVARRDLAPALTGNHCTRVIRATYTKDGVAVTVGVAVFDNDTQASKAARQVDKGYVASLAGSGVPPFCTHTTCYRTSNFYGRYAYFTIAGFTNGNDVKEGDSKASTAGRDLAGYTSRQINHRGEVQASQAANAE